MGNTVNSVANFEGSARSNGFNWSTTADEVVDSQKTNLEGVNVIVTGANTGIGKETAKVLFNRGANVIMACRNKERADEAANDIRAQATKNAGQVSVMMLDLGSLVSVKKFVSEFNEKNIPLNVLINNAGIISSEYTETVDGYESQFAVNHLGHFVLTNLLVDRLKMAQPSRVVCLSSAAHRFVGGHIFFDDLSGKGTWYTNMFSPWKAYGQSKSANIMFASYFNRRMSEQGLDIKAYSCHPGSIKTELGRHLGALIAIVMTIGNVAMKSLSQGAATSVFLATSSELESLDGRYFSDCNVAKPMAATEDLDAQKRLWEISEKMAANIL